MPMGGYFRANTSRFFATPWILALAMMSGACSGNESANAPTAPTPTLGNRTFLSFVAEPGSTPAGGQSGQSVEVTPDNTRLFSAWGNTADGIVSSVTVRTIDPNNER